MTSANTGTNRLAREKSPYLEQHADNPVDWYPWGEEALREAREEDKPIFLSIGYSTCHWCHVMERESFEDEEMARRLNEVFVPVKVDREERPDLDGLYMAVCQSLTGSGGWPLTVLLTPEAKPFFAGTYFPKRSQGRRMGLMELTERVGELWQNQRERLERSAGEILEAVGGGEEAPGDGEALPAEELTRRAYGRLSDSFDEDRGGFGRAPKFPSPQNLLFLLRYGERTGTERAWEMVDRTLKWMRRGGVYDHLGGGFHRYSTDARWLLPHFEKMLHDQALLALASVEAWQVTGGEAHARTAREIFDYARRDLRHPRGGFYAAEDADSEGGEGTFYVWTLEELRSVLPEEDVPVAREAFGVREEGNFAEESTGRRTGENVLHHPRPLADIADELELETGELRERLDGIRARLFEVREERPRPHRDEKVLSDWNGLMIGALARAGAVLDEPFLVDDARETAGFLLSELRDEEGRLLHRWRDGDAGIPAMADDYAFLVFGLLELHQATLEPRWLEEARGLEREFEERCWDPDAGGYYLSGADAEDVPVRRKEVHDGALPSANSMAHWNALRLARLTGDHELEEKALRLEDAFAGRLESRPAAHAMFMVGLDFRVGEGREVVLAGVPGAEGAGPMLDRLWRRFRPRTVLLGLPAREAEADRIRELAPFTREMEPREGRATAYVCRDFSCERPTADPDEMEALLAGSPVR